MESSPEIVDVNVESIKLPETKQEIPESSGSQIKKEAVILPSSSMYIQFGIFSDNEKIKALQQKLNQLNIQTKSEAIKVNGADKVRLITDEFKTKALAKETLLKIKNAGIPGIIKKTS
jgi:ethanolamine utilization protein EutA (predicted chaperonin)